MSRLLAATALAVATVLLLLALDWTGALTRLELLTEDARIVSGLARRPPRDDIVMVWLDQESMDWARQQGIYYPYPRTLWGDAIAYVKGGGARAVVCDVLFSEPTGKSD